MKKFLFFVVVVGFVAAAFFTRPQDPRKSFTDFLIGRMTQGDKSAVHEQWDELRAKRFAEECSYVDRYLWVDVKKEGNTVYTGAFSHWFNRAEVKETVQRNVDDAKQKSAHELDELKKMAGKAADSASHVDRSQDSVTTQP